MCPGDDARGSYESRGVMRRRFWLHLSGFVSVVCLLLVSACSFAESEKSQLDVYFVRHAETVANVTANYSEKNQRTFWK